VFEVILTGGGKMEARIGEVTHYVESMQVNHQSIDSARVGDEIALKVWDYVRKGDLVYREVE
jgi:translation initiation factor IF-1